MTNDEIIDFLENPKKKKVDPNYVTNKSGKQSAWTKEQLNGKPSGGKGHPGYFLGKKLDREKFIEAANAHLSARMNRIDAAKISGVSYPTFSKYLTMLVRDGQLDGSHFTDGNGVMYGVDDNYQKTNDGIYDRITR